METISGRAAEIADKYWRAGVVRAVLVFDACALVVCFADATRFVYGGHSFSAAVRVAAEKAADGEGVALAIAVLTFFLLALPMVLVLLSALLAPREILPKYLRDKARGVLVAHAVLSSCIAIFTVVAVSMEVLSGYENNAAIRYSFSSTWLGIVLLGKPLWVSYVSPIIRKFFIRSPEKTSVREVAKEVLTEEGLGPERAA